MPLVYVDLLAEARAEADLLAAALDAERAIVGEWTARAMLAESQLVVVRGELEKCQRRNRRLRAELDAASTP